MMSLPRIDAVPAANRGMFRDGFGGQTARITARYDVRDLAVWMPEGEAGTDPDYASRLACKDCAEWVAFVADEACAKFKPRATAEHRDVVLGTEDVSCDPVEFCAGKGKVS